MSRFLLFLAFYLPFGDTLQEMLFFLLWSWASIPLIYYLQFRRVGKVHLPTVCIVPRGQGESLPTLLLLLKTFSIFPTLP